ncbi:MAG: sodium:solute symporter family protein [Desulfobacteraceae bacterium]|nr:sodium:solute symporter family protein [Desulfobacteraceae bacterium]
MSGYAIASILVCVAWLGVMVGIGYWSYLRSKSEPSDYFLAGRGLGTLVLVLTNGATFFSMWTFLGAYGTFYRLGVSFTSFSFWQIAIIAPLVYVCGTRIWLLGRRFGFITPADMLGDYYGSKAVHLVTAIVGIVCLFPYAVIQLTGAGKAFVGLTGGEVPFWVGLVLGIVAVGVSTSIGGLRAVGWTDVVQGLFFGLVAWICMFWVIGMAGGLKPIFANAASANPGLLTFPEGGGGWAPYLNITLVWGLAFIFLPHMWQRWYSAKSATVLARAGAFTPFWNCIAMTIPCLVVGLAAYTVLPDLTKAETDMILPIFFKTYAPIFGLVVIAAAFAAGMSSLNSMLLSVGSLFSEDIYHKYFNPGATERRRYYVGRTFVGIFAILMLIFGLSPHGKALLIPLASIGAAFGTTIIPAAIGPLFWPRATKQGAFWSIIAANINMMILNWVPSIAQYYPSGHLSQSTTSSLIVGGLVFIIVSLFTEPLPYSKQEEYHKYLHSMIYRASTASSYDV